MPSCRITTVVAACLAGVATTVSAQPVGTFRWQVHPYCNVITVAVVHQNGVYTLVGSDDLCGAPQAASAIGVAFLNPDGTIGLGVTSVLPGGTPMHLEAAIAVTSLGGTWRDSAGNSGSFVFTLDEGVGGAPRPPAPWVSVPPGSITAVQLANGSVGSGAVAVNAIIGAHVLDGSITGADLANGAIGAAALAANSIGGHNIVDGSLTRVDLKDGPLVVSEQGLAVLNLNAGEQTVVTEVTVHPPADGQVIVNASGTFFMGDDTTAEDVLCSLTPGATASAPFAGFAAEPGASSYRFVPFGGTRTFNVGAGFSATIRLVCSSHQSSVWILHPAVNALFVAGP